MMLKYMVIMNLSSFHILKHSRVKIDNIAR